MSDGERTGLTMCYNIRLLIDCPDHRGLIAAVSGFIALHNGNILSADEHVSDTPSGTFFMRMEIEGRGFGLGRDEFDTAFAPLARQHGMRWRVGFTDRPKRMTVMVSKQGHCLIDMLWRWEAGELDAEIPLVISNHDDLAPKVEA
ncbi:MAG: ACT domain-containing protein, partial [Isosphaeraceae bacterium]